MKLLIFSTKGKKCPSLKALLSCSSMSTTNPESENPDFLQKCRYDSYIQDRSLTFDEQDKNQDSMHVDLTFSFALSRQK